jgi:hypothetical protein
MSIDYKIKDLANDLRSSNCISYHCPFTNDGPATISNVIPIFEKRPIIAITMALAYLNLYHNLSIIIILIELNKYNKVRVGIIK